MDSNVDPRNVWYQANLNQDIAFNRNLKIWFGWLAKYHKFYHLGRTEQAVDKRFYAEKDYLAKHPIQGVVGPDEWVDVFLEAGCYEQTWLEWGSAFANWANNRINKFAPFETWGNARFNAPCLHWPASASRQTPMQINGSGIKNALLIDETLDAATPFEGSLEVRKLTGMVPALR